MDAAQYRVYVCSRDWRLRREELIDRLGAKCFNCGLPRSLARRFDGEDLHVDHLNYSHIGCETPDDVQLLCKRCHEARSFQQDRRKEHLAHSYGRMAKNPEEWAVIAWMALIERGRAAPWKDARVAEMEFMRASEGLSVAEIDTCMAECARQSLWAAVSVNAFRHAAGRLQYEKKHRNKFLTSRRIL